MVLIRDEARRLADQVRETFWGDSLPVEPKSVADRLGISVVVQDLADQASGVIVKKAGQDPQIFLNGRDSPLRRNFTCAHEIGHYVERTMLLDEPDEDYGFVDKRQEGLTDLHEFFANEFAANLLMPEDDVRRGSRDPLAVAKTFGVSVPAARMRLRRLGLEPE